MFFLRNIFKPGDFFEIFCRNRIFGQQDSDVDLFFIKGISLSERIGIVYANLDSIQGNSA